MKCKRLNEVLELLGEHWRKEPDLHLLDLLYKIAEEVGEKDNLDALRDEVLIYQLKMRGKDKSEAIPGIKKDYEEDFKTALLKARGILKD
ncbi:YihD family protein [Otariodibacter sp.]|uniref:YihD family protein n=1 Tax=Otariodibacter sp. TaxID=3030919 RepID=UPI0026128803|nr:YihD family protein [Otariodibacter sp.]